MDPNLGRCSLIITSSRILINQSALLCASPSIFNRANHFCTTFASSSANTENCIQFRPLNINMFAWWKAYTKRLQSCWEQGRYNNLFILSMICIYLIHTNTFGVENSWVWAASHSIFLLESFLDPNGKKGIIGPSPINQTYGWVSSCSHSSICLY